MRDWKNLTKLMKATILRVHKVHVEYRLYPIETANNIRFSKKTLSWKDLLYNLENNHGLYNFRPEFIAKEDYKWLKKLWDHPNLMEPFVVKYRASRY